LNAAFKLVISSNPSVGGLRFAAEASIPARVPRITDYPTPEAYRDAVFQLCRKAGIQLVVRGGFLRHVLIPPDFEHRVANFHPGIT